MGEDPSPTQLSRPLVRFVAPGVLIIVIGLLLDARLWRPDTIFTINENIQIAEAQAWWNGRLDLPERKWDSAFYEGRVYSHFPPLFSLLSALIVPIFDGVPHGFIVAGIVAPVIALTYLLFLRRVKTPAWAVVLTLGLIGGTSVWPVMDKTLRGAGPYVVNQMLALLGMLLLLRESFGRRRVWMGGAGWLMAFLSRQLTIAYLIPLVWMAWNSAGEPTLYRKRRLLGVFFFVIAGGTCVATLNRLKFGNPLESGYRYLYADRPADAFSRDAEHCGIFSFHYIPRNLYYANLGFPIVHRIESAGRQETRLTPNHMGTGIWWTSPLLLLLFPALPKIWRDGTSRAWLMGAVIACAGLMVYHSTGFDQRGHNRYSLDYVPVLFALIAPYAMEGRRRWLTLTLIIAGIAYFDWLMKLPSLRVWSTAMVG